MHDKIGIRSYLPTDEEFIYACWLNHYKHSSLFGKQIRSEIFYKEHHKLIEQLLKRSQITIAYPIGDPIIILGFLVMEGTKADPLIHFTFVKRAFRDMGIAETLTQELDLNHATITHYTKDAEWIMDRCPGMVYNPYKVWG